MNRRGFTLIELMIVVVIIGILAAIAIPRFSNVSKSAKEAEAAPILKQVTTLQERHFQKYDVYASDFASLEGAAEPVSNARYYEFTMDVSGGGFCVSAAPNARGLDAGVASFSMDQARTLHNGAGC